MFTLEWNNTISKSRNKIGKGTPTPVTAAIYLHLSIALFFTGKL